MLEVIKKLRRAEEAVTAIEYGLISALIAVAIIASAQALGTNVSATFTRVSAALAAA